MSTASTASVAEQFDVDAEHVQLVVELAQELGRCPSSNNVIDGLREKGVRVGRGTSKKLLAAFDQTDAAANLTGPRLTVVHPGRAESTGPDSVESTRTETGPEADRTIESTGPSPMDRGTQSTGPTTPSPVDSMGGLGADWAIGLTLDPTGPTASVHRTDHPGSAGLRSPVHPDQTAGSTRTDHLLDHPRSTGFASADQTDQLPRIDPDRGPDQARTTGLDRTESTSPAPDRPVDSVDESTPVHPAEPTPVHQSESTQFTGPTTPDQLDQSTGLGRTESTPVHPEQDRDRVVESTGPTTVAAPSAKAEKLLRSAGVAAEIRAYQTHPDVIALRAEKIRAWTGRLVWTGLIMGLAFTMTNVQQFASKGAEAWTPEWTTAWLLDPMVSLVLIGLLLAESVTSRYGIKMGRWVRAAKWFALGATYAMNTWASWATLDPASILLHSVPPALVFFAAEAITDAWEKITEAVDKAVQQAQQGRG